MILKIPSLQQKKIEQKNHQNREKWSKKRNVPEYHEAAGSTAFYQGL
jgi:hypothetical protein